MIKNKGKDNCLEFVEGKMQQPAESLTKTHTTQELIEVIRRE
jgi:hypothetical protein